MRGDVKAGGLDRPKGRWSGSPKALGTAQAPVGAALPGHWLR